MGINKFCWTSLPQEWTKIILIVAVIVGWLVVLNCDPKHKTQSVGDIVSLTCSLQIAKCTSYPTNLTKSPHTKTSDTLHLTQARHLHKDAWNSQKFYLRSLSIVEDSYYRYTQLPAHWTKVQCIIRASQMPSGWQELQEFCPTHWAPHHREGRGAEEIMDKGSWKWIGEWCRIIKINSDMSKYSKRDLTTYQQISFSAANLYPYTKLWWACKRWKQRFAFGL